MNSVVWDMLSDKKIWALLGNVKRALNEDTIRLMFIELFSRLKTLEEENLALRVILNEANIYDEELFARVLKVVREYLAARDEEKAQESEFFASSGISFSEWVNFKLYGSFHKPSQ